MENKLIFRLKDHVEPFLTKWAEGMDRAGYLKYTTAKREDCIESFRGFLSPIMEHMETGQKPSSFGEQIQNKKRWTDTLMGIARRHRFRGVTADMFLGCFKTLIHAIEEIILEMDGTNDEKLDAISIIRRWSDAFETILMGDWTAMTQQEAIEKLTEANRKLTLDKNKYENILASTMDMVLVTDSNGVIIEANPSVSKYLGPEDHLGQYFWDILELEGNNITEVMRYYNVNEDHEISFFDNLFIFRLRIIPLQWVSLASKGYMILLTNVSCFVGQREILEKTVTERTTALENKEKQFKSLFQAAGESILLIDIDFRIIEANNRSGEIFGIPTQHLQGITADKLCHPEKANLKQAIRNLDEGEVWEGEIMGQRANGQVFPMAVTINRIDLDTRTVFHVLVRDVTKQKELEENLVREKTQIEEMNITLCNVMKSVNHEKEELQKSISKKVHDLLLPSLDKVQNESTSAVQKGYLEIIKDQLVKLSNDGNPEKKAYLLSMTPTEMQICQFIQSGSATKDIALSMCLSEDTIKTHRKNIRKKLGLRGRHINLYTFLNNL